MHRTSCAAPTSATPILQDARVFLILFVWTKEGASPVLTKVQVFHMTSSGPTAPALGPNALSPNVI